MRIVLARLAISTLLLRWQPLTLSDSCFSTAGFSTDIASCDALHIPAGAVAATGAAGTFRTRVTDPAGPGGVALELADFDLTLTFLAEAGVPTSDHLVGH